jgi:hypothetical protein
VVATPTFRVSSPTSRQTRSIQQVLRLIGPATTGFTYQGVEKIKNPDGSVTYKQTWQDQTQQLFITEVNLMGSDVVTAVTRPINP